MGLAFYRRRSSLLRLTPVVVVGASLLVALVCAQYFPYSYNGNANLLSYFPPQFLPYFTPLMTNILGGIPANQLPVLFHALSSFNTWPNLLHTLQFQAPALFNAYNQMHWAYAHNYPLLYPGNQAIMQGLINGFRGVLYNAMQGMHGLSPAAVGNFNQFMPGLTQFFFSKCFLFETPVTRHIVWLFRSRVPDLCQPLLPSLPVTLPSTRLPSRKGQCKYRCDRGQTTQG